jgi:hypothetical protein
MKVVRMIRVARLTRTFRLLVQFRTLWLLVYGLKASLSTIVWAFVLIMGLVYVFAILGMEMVPPPEWADMSSLRGGDGIELLPEADQIAIFHFGDLTNAMISLVQLLTLDSSAEFYRPLIAETGQSQGLFFTVYVALFMLFVSIALMNLVTAVILENSLAQASEDKELMIKNENARKLALVPKLRAMFSELDEDESGEVSLDEIQNAPKELKDTLQHMTSMDDLGELFGLLDYDNSGFVDVEEFLEGVLRASSGDAVMKLQMAHIVRQCFDIRKMNLELLRADQ